MGIEALLAELRSRAREDEAEIRRESETEAERIVERARAEAEEERTRALEEAERELRVRLRAERARVENEVRGQVMDARHELLGRVRDRALELTAEATDADTYRSRLRERIRDARSCLPEDADVVLRCSPSLEKPIREALAGVDGDVRVEVGPEVEAGFRATTPGGAVTADATLGRRLERDWPELTMGVLEELEERWAATGDR